MGIGDAAAVVTCELLMVVVTVAVAVPYNVETDGDATEDNGDDPMLWAFPPKLDSW